MDQIGVKGKIKLRLFTTEDKKLVALVNVQQQQVILQGVCFHGAPFTAAITILEIN